MHPDNVDQVDVFISILLRQVKGLEVIRDALKSAKSQDEVIELLQNLCDELKFNNYTLQEMRDLLQ